MRKRFRRIPILLFSALLAGSVPLSRAQAPSTSKPRPEARWENDIRAFEAADRTNPPPRGAVEFAGSSSIRLWKDAPSFFPDHKVFTRGFGGSQMSDLLAYAKRIIIPYRPNLVLVYEGDNDLAAGKSPERVLADYKVLVEEIRSALPETRIGYIAVKPCPAREKLLAKVKDLNHLIEDYAASSDKLLYVDVFSPMLSSDGKPRPDLFRNDGLHPNARGYAIWIRVVRPILARYDQQKQAR